MREILAKAKKRREKKRNKSKAAVGPKTSEKKKKKQPSNEAAAAPTVPLSQKMKAKLEEQKAKKRAKKQRQKEKKLAEGGEGVKEANFKMMKAKKKPLGVEITALQEKFGKQKEKIRLWKVNQKEKKANKAKAVVDTPRNVLTKEEKNKKKNLKKKQRLARKKKEGVAVFKPRKGRKGGMGVSKEEAMVE